MIFVAAVVEACGNAADDVAAAVDDVAGRFGSTIELVNQHGGVASASALNACHTAWSGRIRLQGADAAIAGIFLHQAVKEHVGTDDSNADGIRSAGRNRPI